MNKTRCFSLAPGVYRNSRGNQRLLLGTMEHRCLYSMDGTDADVIHGTICSGRTFHAAMGEMPVRAFTQEEVKHIKAGFNAMRSRRRSNRFEKWLFYSEAGKETVRQLIQKLIIAEPTVPKGWLERCRNILWKVIAWIKQILGIRKSEPTVGTMGEGKPATV